MTKQKTADVCMYLAKGVRERGLRVVRGAVEDLGTVIDAEQAGRADNGRLHNIIHALVMAQRDLTEAATYEDAAKLASEQGD